MSKRASRVAEAFTRSLRLSKSQVVLIRSSLAGLILFLAILGLWPWSPDDRAPRRALTMAMCKELEMGVDNFFAEYGWLPLQVEADVTYDLNSPEGSELLGVLLSLEVGANPLNSKGIRFIDIKEARRGKNGIVYSESGDRVVGLYDSWGGSYKIRVDGDGDEVIDVRPKASKAAKRLQGRRAAVWSDGPDGVKGTGKSSDDVTTW